MLKIRRITDPDSEDARKLMDLLVKEFPLQERREESQLSDLIAHEDRMYFNAIDYDGVMSGLLIYWRFEDFSYVEFLVIFDEYRTNRVGAHAVDWILANLGEDIIFEIEPVVDRYTLLREKLYERKGFKVIKKDFHQPAFRPDDKPSMLWIMGTQGPEKLPPKIDKLMETVYRL